MFQIRRAQHHLFHAVHLQGAHAAGHGRDEDLGDAGTFLNELLDFIVGDQQFVQADSALVAGLVALVAPDRLVETQPPVLAIGLDPALVQLLGFARVVGFPRGRVAQVLGVLGDEGLDLVGVGEVRLLAVAQLLGQTLRQDPCPCRASG